MPHLYELRPINQQRLLKRTSLIRTINQIRLADPEISTLNFTLEHSWLGAINREKAYFSNRQDINRHDKENHEISAIGVEIVYIDVG